MGGISIVGLGLWDEIESLAISGMMSKGSGFGDWYRLPSYPKGKKIWVGEMELEKSN